MRVAIHLSNKFPLDFFKKISYNEQSDFSLLNSRVKLVLDSSSSKYFRKTALVKNETFHRCL